MNSFLILTRIFLRASWTDKSKLISTLLFALSVFLVFEFSLDALPSTWRPHLIIAEYFIALFFALSVHFIRAFDTEFEDEAYLVLCTSDVKSEVWMGAKFVVLLLDALLIAGACALLSSLLNSHSMFAELEFYAVLLPALIGWVAVGLSLSAIVMRLSGGHLLFSALFLPLCSPIILGAIHASKDLFLRKISLGELLQSWIGMLLLFDVIYLGIAILVFAFLIGKERSS